MKYLVLSIFTQFTIGIVWYGLWFKQYWIKSTQISPTEIHQIGNGTIVHLWPILSAITNTIFLEIVFKNTSTRGISGAMRWALLLWLMIILPTSLHHHAYQGKYTLWIIDAGKDLVCLLAAGLFVGINNKKAF